MHPDISADLLADMLNGRSGGLHRHEEKSTDRCVSGGAAGEHDGHSTVPSYDGGQLRGDKAEALQDRIMVRAEVSVMDRSMVCDLVSEDAQVVEFAVKISSASSVAGKGAMEPGAPESLVVGVAGAEQGHPESEWKFVRDLLCGSRKSGSGKLAACFADSLRGAEV
ncbi:hypothetical protein [Sinosporangium siamense]|uniref:hypothetical protein n=1 Tax=Sinosporangium siamense TaxID=1367973 RepID=UPI0019517685|nr:hypothetical protein [Sinosporangium siamense]